MASQESNGGYVGFGRYDAEHQALVERVTTLERHSEQLRGAEQEHRAIIDRIAVLEQTGKADMASERSRRDRLWLIVIGMMTGIVCPLIVTSIITWLHLKALK